MKNKIWIFLIFIISNLAFGQTRNFKNFIETNDIENFWKAFDEVNRTQDSTQKIAIFQKIYIDNASIGLTDFIASRSFTSKGWVKSFNDYPKFWKSIRQKTECINKDFEEVENIYVRFKKLYENFKPPQIYYTIGNLKGGGTVINGNLIIGSELASSDKNVDFSELPINYQDRMKINSGIIFLTTHELVHTQQKLNNNKQTNLLGMCIKEGSADFLTELILQRKVEAPYIDYGIKNQCSLWGDFQKEMNGYEYQNWLSNNATMKEKTADLGYFIGYIITKKYYENSKNKKRAIKEIIKLDFSDINATKEFLKKSEFICD
ncbi:DUF2268 domain-containing protein [Flavobacterium branchiophilum]|uniref:DUF2268 domain-containing protein n=1 Tax=Flavobacterium branchiophilum (strain FL-15) TaxID=1034807 RepID=G2Z4R3_FLABF|nr:hypothetical protein [Flavobacterium branchiophilum]CCB70625.1 Protein of unknown function precursor [Flavobacterium branchiophilum FL-15]